MNFEQCMEAAIASAISGLGDNALTADFVRKCIDGLATYGDEIYLYVVGTGEGYKPVIVSADALRAKHQTNGPVFGHGLHEAAEMVGAKGRLGSYTIGVDISDIANRARQTFNAVDGAEA